MYSSAVVGSSCLMPSLMRRRSRSTSSTTARTVCPDRQRLARMIQTLLARDVGDVNHAVDAAAQIDEAAEVGQAGHRAFGHRAHRILLQRVFPRIAQGLLQTQRNPAVGRVHSQHHRLHHLAGLQKIAGLLDLLRPRHLGNVDQSVHARQQLHERAEIGQARNLALHAIAGMKPFGRQGPRIGRQLLQAQ